MLHAVIRLENALADASFDKVKELLPPRCFAYAPFGSIEMTDLIATKLNDLTDALKGALLMVEQKK